MSSCASLYEWTGPKGKRQPLWIHPSAGNLMLFAGLYESWDQPVSPLADSVKNEGPALLEP